MKSSLFESHSSCHEGTLDINKSFTHNCLKRFGVLTPTQYQCSSWEQRCQSGFKTEESCVQVRKLGVVGPRSSTDGDT